MKYIYTDEDMYVLQKEDGYITATRNDRYIEHVIPITMEEFESLPKDKQVKILRKEFSPKRGKK